MRLSKWFYTLPLRFHSLFRRNRVEQELNDEMQYHLIRGRTYGPSGFCGGADPFRTGRPCRKHHPGEAHFPDRSYGGAEV